GCVSHELRPLHSVANEYEAATATGDGALNEQQALLSINGLNFEVLHGHAIVAHAASHVLAAEHATRSRRATDGTRFTVVAVCTVRSRGALEVVTLHGAGETLTLRGANDVDQLAGLEHTVDSELLAQCIIGSVSGAHLSQMATRGDACLGEVASRGLVHP